MSSSGRAVASTHVFRVPEGWSVEQAWEFIRRHERFPRGTPKRTRFWVNLRADEFGRMISWVERDKPPKGGA